MPELGWFRRRLTLAAEGLRPREPADPDAGDGAPSASNPGYLHEAARCYLRAGNLTEAASCLGRLGEHGRAAELYLELGDYEQAATAYRAAGQLHAAAWVYAHYLNDPDAARTIVERASALAMALGVAERVLAEPGLASELLLQERIRRVCEHLASMESEPPDLYGPQSAARPRIVGLATEADLSSDRDLSSLIGQAGALKRTAITAGDWPAGYAARQIEGMLADEQTARTADRDGAARAGWQGRRQVNALCCAQVLARCDAAEGAGQHRIVPVLRQTQELLADPAVGWVPRIETWGVAVAEAVRRYDQAALILAASVRGRRPGAEARWREWSARVLDTDSAMSASAEAG